MIQRRDLDDEMLALIRRVARSLSRGDSHLAEDLEQETILTALSSRPRDPRFMEPWLRKIAWNRLFTHRAREARSKRHGERVGDPETPMCGPEADPAEETARQELRRELRKRVADLPEIYRSAVTMRVLEGRPPRVVARELALPVETVRTRVRRGLELLRADIGGEDRWAGLRAALASLPFFRRSKLIAAVGLVSAAGVAVALQPSESGPSPGGPHDRALLASGDPAREPVLAPSHCTREVIGDTAIEVVASPAAPGDASVQEERAFVIQVVDASGAPSPETDVFAQWDLGLTDRRHLGQTNADGKLSIRVPVDGCWLAARGAPGLLSDAIYLDQPSLGWGAPVRLELKERAVAWVQVDGSDSEESDLSVQLWPSDVRKKMQLRPDSGLFGLSSWVPAWTQGENLYGLAWGDYRKCIVVSRGDETLWWGPLSSRKAAPPEAIDLRSAWEVTGRVLTSDGLPVEGYPVFVPSDPEAGSRRHGQSIVTGADGQFRVGAMAMPAARILIGRDLELPAVEPMDGTGLRSVDLGDIDLGRLNVDQETLVSITGFHGPVEVSAIHNDESKLWTGYRLAHPDCKRIIGLGDDASDVVQEGRVRIPESSEDLASVVITGVDPTSGETVRLFHYRPIQRPLPTEIHVEGPLPALGTIILENPSHGRSGRLLLVERRSGFRRYVDIPGRVAGMAGQGVRVPVSPGLWDLFFLSPDGPILTRRAVTIDPGSTHDFGVFSEPAGTVQFDWTQVEQGGDPYDSVMVRWLRRGEVIASEAVPRGQLSERWASRVEIPHDYRLVASVAGDSFSGFVRVVENQRATLTPAKDLIVLSVKVRMERKAPGFPAGTIDLFDSTGKLVERRTVDGDATGRRYRMMAPPLEGMSVKAEFHGRRFEGSVGVDQRQRIGSVVLRPVPPK